MQRDSCTRRKRRQSKARTRSPRLSPVRATDHPLSVLSRLLVLKCPVVGCTDTRAPRRRADQQSEAHVRARPPLVWRTECHSYWKRARSACTRCENSWRRRRVVLPRGWSHSRRLHCALLTTWASSPALVLLSTPYFDAAHLQKVLARDMPVRSTLAPQGWTSSRASRRWRRPVNLGRHSASAWRQRRPRAHPSQPLRCAPSRHYIARVSGCIRRILPHPAERLRRPAVIAT